MTHEQHDDSTPDAAAEIAEGRVMLADLQQILSRVHQQTATLGTVSGGLMAAGIAILMSGRLPAALLAGGVIAIVLNGSAFWFMLAASRPDLRGGFGFVVWRLGIDRARAAMRTHHDPLELARIIHRTAEITHEKSRANQRATDLMRAGLAVIAAAVVVHYAGGAVTAWMR